MIEIKMATHPRSGKHQSATRAINVSHKYTPDFKKKPFNGKFAVPNKRISLFGATASLFRVYSHSMNLFLLTLLSMLDQFNFQKKKKKKLFVFQALNPQISPAPHLFGHPSPQGRRSTGLFPYDSLIGAADAGLGHFALNGSSSFQATFHCF